MVGLQELFSFTGKCLGFPITINVLPKINRHFKLRILIDSKIFNVDFVFESRSKNGFSKDFE